MRKRPTRASAADQGVRPAISAGGLLGAQMTTSCGQITYEDRNQTDYGPLRVGVVEGHARDDVGSAIPNVCLGLFSEPDHKLVTTAQADVKGAFRFRRLASGRYRIVAKYEGFCPANAILLVEPTARKSLRIHMKPAGIDTCSYVDLANRARVKNGSSSFLPRTRAAISSTTAGRCL
jgi:hypothetical protein